MQTQLLYIIPNKVTIQLVTDASIDRKWRMNYSTPVKIYQGTDNTIKFIFKNNDQKPVNITGFTVTLHIIDDFTGYPTNSQGSNPQVSIALPGTIVNGPSGIATVLVPASVLVDLDNNYYNYTVAIVDNLGNAYVAYSTEDYQVRGQLELANGSFPSFRESTSIIFSAQTQGTSNPSFNDQNTFFNIDALNPINATSDGIAADITSGTGSRGYHTAQYNFDNFTGTVNVQASLDPVSNAASVTNWITVLTNTYTTQDTPDVQVWQGVYNFVRFQIINNSGYTTYAFPVPFAYAVTTDLYIIYNGNVTEILYRS